MVVMATVMMKIASNYGIISHENIDSLTLAIKLVLLYLSLPCHLGNG